jgi:predicted RNase H-like HicB family nuclease
MEKITIESIPIVVGREDDRRWWADIESMPGVMAYGTTRESAIAAVRALALRVAADWIDHGEEVPEPFIKVSATPDEITEMASRGEDVSAHFTNKFTVVRQVRRK